MARVTYKRCSESATGGGALPALSQRARLHVSQPSSSSACREGSGPRSQAVPRPHRCSALGAGLADRPRADRPRATVITPPSHGTQSTPTQNNGGGKGEPQHLQWNALMAGKVTVPGVTASTMIGAE